MVEKMLDPVKTRKSQQATKRKLLKDTLDSEWLPIPPVKLDIDGDYKKKCKLIAGIAEIAQSSNAYAIQILLMKTIGLIEHLQ